jgi:hypothetical protein
MKISSKENESLRVFEMEEGFSIVDILQLIFSFPLQIFHFKKFWFPRPLFSLLITILEEFDFPKDLVSLLHFINASFQFGIIVYSLLKLLSEMEFWLEFKFKSLSRTWSKKSCFEMNSFADLSLKLEKKNWNILIIENIFGELTQCIDSEF